jgi:hypothetical protein
LQRNIGGLQIEWNKVYFEVKSLREKKLKAEIECSKKVRLVMASGLCFLIGNIAFIWSGTYIFYSWDIIEPVAYFLSSFAGILLTASFLKMKKLYSNLDYK